MSKSRHYRTRKVPQKLTTHKAKPKKCYYTDSNSHSEYSIKKLVWDELEKNPLLLPKQICAILHFHYPKSGAYVRKLKSEWKRDYKIGLHPKSPIIHAARAVCRAPKQLDRVEAIHIGWVQSKNRNRVLFWKNRAFGRIEWWETGKVLVWIKKPQTMARVKRFLCIAFFESGLIYSPVLLDAFLAKVHWKGAHNVFETSERLPYNVITNYEESHGIKIITGDASHPNCIEVHWVYPDWLERLELMQQHNIKTLEDFATFMKALSTPKPLRDDASGMVV